MSNFTIAYANTADLATLSGGSWSATAPLNNLKDYRVAKKARTTNTLAASSIVRFSMPSSPGVHLGAVALPATNATIQAQYRVRLYPDNTFSGTPDYDSGLLELYPSGSVPNGYYPWGSPEFNTGRPELADVLPFQRNIVHVLTTPMYGQYGQIEVIDTANADGYLEFGRLFIGKLFRPAINAKYGATSLQLQSRTEMSLARDGTPYFNVRKPTFSIPVGFEWLTDHEGMRALEMQAVCDVHGEVLAMWDSDDVSFWWRRQVFGRLAQLNPIEHPMFGTYATAFQVEGQI